MRFHAWFSDEGELLFSRADEVEYLGQGAFGKAYRIIDDGTVLKVGRHSCGTSYVIEVCYLLRRNGHQVPAFLPEVYAFERQEGTSIWFAQMEFVHVDESTYEYAPKRVQNFLEEVLPKGWAGDYHSGNWGTRKNGDIVLFDPSGAVEEGCLSDEALELLYHVRAGGSMGLFLSQDLQVQAEDFREDHKPSKYSKWNANYDSFWDLVRAYPRRITGEPRTRPGFKEQALRNAAYSWERAYYMGRAKRLMSPKQFREFAVELQTRRKQCEEESQRLSCSQQPASPYHMRATEEALQP